MKNMLIFTEDKIGAGHYKVAQSVQKAMHETRPEQWNITIMSGLRCIHPSVEWFVVKSYFSMLRHAPQLWGYLYEKNKKSSFLQKNMFAWKLSKLIEKEKPDMILCTHPTCIPALTLIRERRKAFPFQLGCILTDYSFHPYVVSQQVDLYYVADKSIKQRLIHHYGLSPKRIYDYGIPLDPAYDQFNSQANVFEYPTSIQVLLMGGGNGWGRLKQMVHTLQPYTPQIQLIVICGNNGKLYDELHSEYFDHEHISVLGYVQRVERYMNKADVLVSKPGGLTITEAIACGTPIIVIDPIPGQETANVRFLEEKGLARCLPDLTTLPETILRLKQDEQGYLEWKGRLQSQHRHRAAYKIARSVVEHIQLQPLFP